MKLVMLAVTCLTLIPAASAQSVPGGGQANGFDRLPAASARSVTGGSHVFDSRYDPSARGAPRDEPLECLSEKASKRRICRTRYQWAQIARRIEKGQPWR
jgi:hypothetical protein